MPERPKGLAGIQHLGFTPDFVLILHDIYRLLAAIYAAEHFDEESTGLAWDPIGTLESQFEQNDIERGLLSSAIGVRIILDRHPRDAFADLDSCGSLVPDLASSGETTPLSLREACNKIIHAEEIRFEVDDAKRPKKIFPVLYLYGKKGASSWKATVDLVAYSKAIVRLTSLAV